MRCAWLLRLVSIPLKQSLALSVQFWILKEKSFYDIQFHCYQTLVVRFTAFSTLQNEFQQFYGSSITEVAKPHSGHNSMTVVSAIHEWRFRHGAWRGVVGWGVGGGESNGYLCAGALLSCRNYTCSCTCVWVYLSCVRFPLINGTASISAIQSEEKNGCLASV